MTSKRKRVYLVSNGDLRGSACQLAWPKQEETLKLCEAAFAKLGVEIEVLTAFRAARTGGAER